VLEKNKEIFITNMVNLRESLGLTQAEMASALDVNLKTYQKYEYKRAFPGPGRYHLIEKALKVSISDLFKDPNEVKPEQKPSKVSDLSVDELIKMIQKPHPVLEANELIALIWKINDPASIRSLLRDAKEAIIRASLSPDKDKIRS
jgi:transcriptional regulator with XRE-family HTH domain